MSVALINPNLIVQRNDPLTTGIVYMPISLAYVAAALRRSGQEPQVIDAFAERPTHARRSGRMLVLGVPEDEVADRVAPDATAAFVYANAVVNHVAVIEIVRALRQRRPSLPVVVLENTQAVTAYALRPIASELFAAGAGYVLAGEADETAVALSRALAAGATNGDLRAITGLSTPEWTNPRTPVIRELDALPLPAWDLFPLERYWGLGFAHGPLSANRYLPLLTSRGCPWPCRFCVVPETNDRRWRPRSAKSVVDEMEQFRRTLDIHEFHVEDLNPTVSDSRTRAICEEIIARRLQVTWKLAAGTKVETIKSDETVDLLARAGCRYVSISPETGSQRLLKDIGKTFDVNRARSVVRRMSERGIHSQACFVVGYPGEEREDRLATRRLVQQLTRDGLDEIAVFMITPVPGSGLFGELHGYDSLSELTFSPAWRADFRRLSRFRLRLYATFLLNKLVFHPRKLLPQPVRFLRGRFETKMEMTPYRALVWKRLDVLAGMQSIARRRSFR